MYTDLLLTMQWWITWLLIGLLFLPATSLLFPRFIDRGYIFAKSIGIILLSYVLLVVGITHLLPFTLWSVILLLVVIAGGGTVLAAKQSRQTIAALIGSLFIKRWHWYVLEEALFFLVLLFWAYIRSFAPDVNGLEKFMDYGFVNSILRAEYFPPHDMWFTPFSINYYYFGHLVTAVITKLSLLPSSITYNLMIATIAGLTFSHSFSIAINLSYHLNNKHRLLKYIAVGILTAAIVTFAGNLHTLYTLFKPYENEHPVPLTKLVFAPQTYPNNYWYPNATRFIHNTIHEFPIYSWTVSDLHGHVLDIPFVLVTIAFLYSLLLHIQEGYKPIVKKSKGLLRYYYRLQASIGLPLSHLITSGFLLAVLYMTNAWDGIIYFLLAATILAFSLWQSNKKTKELLLKKLVKLVQNLIIPFTILGGGFVLFSLPFSLFFKPFVSGIGIICAPKFLTDLGHIGPFLFEVDHCQSSPLWQLLILHGFFFVFILAFLFFLWRTKKVVLTDVFVLMLMGVSTLLIIIPEFMYVKDIYPAHYRANTMFKLVFQAFIMLGIATGYSISRIFTHLKSNKSLGGIVAYVLFFVMTLSLLVTVFSYPYFAINSYYNNAIAIRSKDPKTGELVPPPPLYKGLDGSKYLTEKYPDDAAAISWLNKQIKGQPVILEAQGDSYTDYGRVSTNTGLPTLLGWTVHEWLWRGSYDIPSPRIEEVKQLFESDNLEKTKELVKKYHVQYVFLGTLEHEKYTVNEDKFKKLGKLVFQKGTTKIYKISLK